MLREGRPRPPRANGVAPREATSRRQASCRTPSPRAAPFPRSGIATASCGVPRIRASMSTNVSGRRVSSVEPWDNVAGPIARRSSARFQRSEPSGSSAPANSSSARCSREGLRTRLSMRYASSPQALWPRGPATDSPSRSRRGLPSRWIASDIEVGAIVTATDGRRLRCLFRGERAPDAGRGPVASGERPGAPGGQRELPRPLRQDRDELSRRPERIRDRRPAIERKRRVQLASLPRPPTSAPAWAPAPSRAGRGGRAPLSRPTPPTGSSTSRQDSAKYGTGWLLWASSALLCTP